MALIGADFSGGLGRRLYAPSNPAGLVWALVFAVLLVVINQLLQGVFGIISAKTIVNGDLHSPADLIKGYMIGLFPASVLTALCAWVLTKFKGGQPAEVLNLRRPELGGLGWVLLIGGFLVSLYGLIIVIVMVLDVDLAQYTPGESGDNSSSVGIVKQAMFDIAHDPRLFLLVLPSVVLGAPLAEEFIFRGQLFSALSQSRAGMLGATLITSALWAVMHITETWLSIGLIFVMGLVFGYLLYRFGSLWITLACHAVWNTIYSLAIFGSIQT